MKKFTLQEKMTKTFIAVFTCILLVTTILMSVIISRVYFRKSYQLCEQLVNLNLNLLNDRIIKIQKTQEMIAKNMTVKDTVHYFKNQKARDYALELEYRRKLDEIFYQFTKEADVSGAYIIDKNGEYLYFYKESLKTDYNMLDEEWYRSLVETIYMNTCYVSGLHDRNYLVNDKGEQSVSMVMPIQTKEGYTFAADAFLVCDISVESILNMSRDKDGMQFAILDKDGQLFSMNSLGLAEGEKERVIALAGQQDTYVETLQRNLFAGSIVVSMKSKIFGWKVIGVKELQEIEDVNIAVVIILCVTLLMAVAVVSFLSKRIARTILLPMNYLVTECNQVAAGDYHVQFTDKKSEEVSFLSDTIQEMVSNVVELSNRVVEEEKKLSEEKLRVLQHQINPHFLNNVLQTIKALAVSGEMQKVSRMSTLLGHILSYSVYEPYQNVKLHTELEYLKNYIELQNIRYDNKVLYTIDCETEAEEVEIPKLTLQPLVENAIEHGYQGKDMLIISISAEMESDMVCIIIHDNGQGMTEEELQMLERRLQTGEVYEQKCSVGIVNVNERLQRTFGERYGVDIHSKEAGGTTVIVRIPKRKENKNEGTFG